MPTNPVNLSQKIIASTERKEQFQIPQHWLYLRIIAKVLLNWRKS